MIKYIDVHCHLDFDKIIEKKDEMVLDMKKKNVVAISNTLNFENYIETKKKYENYENVYVIPGFYPDDAKNFDSEKLDKYLNYLRLNAENFIAIGEVGLDLKNTKEDSIEFENQKKVFRRMIEIAVELDKPIIIHSRNSEKIVLDIIEGYVKSFNFNKFILHCFMGTIRTFRKIKLLKIYCSIPNIVFTNELLKELVLDLSLNRIFVETDSPYLNHKRKFPNTPLNVVETYKEISRLKNIEESEIKKIIYKNFEDLFLID